MPRNVKFTDGSGKSNEHGMARSSRVAGVEFGFPLIEQFERCRGIAGFIAEIVGDAAVGIKVEEMLTQALGQEPSRYREIFVMSACEVFAVGVSIRQGRRLRGNGVFRGQMGPDLISGAQTISS